MPPAFTSAPPARRTAADGWLPSVLRSDARVRLFCLPHAGGSAAAFSRWTALVPPWIDVCPIHLPGRGVRLSEPPLRSVSAVVDALAAAVAPRLDRPFALFGHSVGAVIAFELARRLRRVGAPPPGHLFVAGRRAPQIPLDDADTELHLLPDDEFIAALARLYGTPAEVLADAELMQILLPVLRADFEVSRTYAFVPEAPLDTPISAYGGLRDDIARDALVAWRHMTSGTFVLRMFPGDHFFVSSDERTLIPLIVRDLYGLDDCRGIPRATLR